MIRAHKIRLYPNNKQETYFRKACGCARFAYNWGLSKWKELYEQGEKPTAGKIDKMLNAVKKEQFPWMKDVTKYAVQLAIQEDLKNAFQKLYKKTGKYPVFKKKGVRDRFRMYSDLFKVENRNVWIPKLGWVRMAQELRYSGKLLYGTVSRKADKWFISISVEVPDAMKIHPKSENQAVGVDLGVKALATLSDGQVVAGRQVTKEFAGKVRRLQKELSRRKGAKKDEEKSKNYRKTQMKLVRVYVRMMNIRDDQLHKLTHSLTRNYGVIGIEDLNVAGMLKNHRLAGAIQDRSFSEFRRQLEYKAKETGSVVVVADRFFASSKTCNVCGIKNSELALADRGWLCGSCGTHHDRDVNAAINLRNNAVGVTVSACGEFGAVRPSMKQEASTGVVTGQSRKVIQLTSYIRG